MGEKEATNVAEQWNKFRDSGMLWFVNRILHVFGWVINIDVHKGTFIAAYPMQTKLRGFSEASEERGYKKVTEYMKENMEFIESAFEEDKEGKE